MKPDIPESDIQQDLKKGARRRLMGAALFVIVVATGLPLVMDATPPPQLNDFRIVTEEEKRAASVPVAAPVESLPRVGDAPAPVPLPATVTTSVDVKPVDVAPTSGPTAPVVVASASPAPAAPSAPDIKPVDSDKPVEKKPVTAGQYYIQVGVFADVDNVKQVRAKLKSQGIASWTEEATGNLAGKTRVKAGPFPNRDAAEKALAKITKAGLSGLVVKK